MSFHPSPASPETLFASATQLHQQGQIERAEAAYQQLLALHPSHLQGLQMLGIAQMQLGLPDRAIDTMLRALAIQPRDADLLTNLGAGFEALGQWQDALTRYNAALDLHAHHLIALSNRSHVLRRLGHAEQALDSAEKALAQQPAHTSAWVNQGAALADMGRLSEALVSYERAIAIQPGHTLAWLWRGRALLALQRPEEAMQNFERALQLHPQLADAWLEHGRALTTLSRSQEALSSYSQALAIWTGQLAAGRGNAAQIRASMTDGLSLYDDALRHSPELADAWYNRGNVLAALQRQDEAIDSFDRTLALTPQHANAWNNRAKALVEAGRLEEALADYEKALRIEPDHVVARYNYGNTLLQLDRPSEALESIDRALKSQPGLGEAWLARGNALMALKRHADALESYDKALSLGGLTATTWSNRGHALLSLKRYPEALVSLDRALQLQPDLIGALNNRGNVWLETQHPDRALKEFERVIQLEPDDPEAWWNHGNALMLLGRMEEALASHSRTLALDPSLAQTTRPIMHSLQHLVLWPRLGTVWPAELEHTRSGVSDSAPFPMLAHPLAAAVDLRTAGNVFYSKRLAIETMVPLPARSTHRPKVRVAYVSGDFRDHALARLTAGMYGAHDRDRFEIFGISYSPPCTSSVRQRIEASFDHFIDITKLSDAQASARLRELEIDIAVDLTGYTQSHRFGIFAHRSAPIQVNYLGYPGTSGAPVIDYIIGDRWVTPLDQAEAFSEQLVLMPDSFQANDDLRSIAADTPSRAALGLPENAFVFCCFNNTYKITPQMYDIWMRLLSHVPGSVLWLLGDSETARRNLRLEAQARGVDPERIVFAQRRPYEEYLAQYRQADLFLDTLPFNAGTTASDALWAGLPVLTQLGHTFAGRMAASLLDNVGLPELIARSAEDYEALALKLASEPALLKTYRDRLAASIATAPLFNTARFTRHLERAFLHMIERQRLGLPPKSFSVAPLLPPTG